MFSAGNMTLLQMTHYVSAQRMADFLDFIFHTWRLILFLLLKTLDCGWATDSLSHVRVSERADEQYVHGKLICFWMLLRMMLCLKSLCRRCILFGHGWTASVLHPLRWSSLRVAFCWCCSRLYSSNSNFSLWLFVSCFRPHIFFLFPFLSSLLFSSLSVCFSPFLYSLLSITPQLHLLYTRRAPVPPRQTYPITRTITIKAKLWIKGMISPQWPMPWRGWAPLRLSQPCPAVQDPSPACMTASCSARAARRPSRGWRWLNSLKLPRSS